LAAGNDDTENGSLYRNIISSFNKDYEDFKKGIGLIKQSDLYKSASKMIFDKEQFNKDMERLQQTDTYQKISTGKIGQFANRQIEEFRMLGDLGSAAINYGANYVSAGFYNGLAGTNNNIRFCVDLGNKLINSSIETGKDLFTKQGVLKTGQSKKGRVINLGALDNGINSLLSSPIKLKKNAQTGYYTIAIKGKPKAANMDVCIIPGKTLNLSNASLLPGAPAHSIALENDIR